MSREEAPARISNEPAATLHVWSGTLQKAKDFTPANDIELTTAVDVQVARKEKETRRTPDAASRFPHDLTVNSKAAWYNGDIASAVPANGATPSVPTPAAR